MAQSSEEPNFTLRLLIDEEKNKVVLAEAGRDFVDVLFSLLTLPMGTIVRLLEKHRQSGIGCFSNLYKSVVGMGIDNFETEACKQMLLYPRSLNEVHCKRLKLNVNPTEDIKFYTCSNSSLCSMCSNFSCSKCKCGRLMDKEIQLTSKVQNDVDGVFISSRSSFIITDNLKVSVDSTGPVLKALGSLGCADVSKLGERLVDIGLEEVLTLLDCMFSSNTPLTDTFLKLHDVTQKYQLLSPCVEKKEDGVEPDKLITLEVVVRKQDMKILYVECCEDFVDVLFTFLAFPLESICEITGNDITLGCVGNLHRSFKELSVKEKTEGSSSSSKCVLPYYYRCQKQLLNITFEEPPVCYLYKNYNPRQPDYCLTTNYHQTGGSGSVILIDPKSRGSEQSNNGSWFMKRETRFMVSDDLIITPRNSSSTSIGLLKKLQIQADDVDVQVIRIGNAEALNLLRASLVLTSSALSSAFRNLIAKKLKEERVLWNPIPKKQRF